MPYLSLCSRNKDKPYFQESLKKRDAKLEYD